MGVWAALLSSVSPEHSMMSCLLHGGNVSWMLSILYPLQNQVVVAAGRSSWGARLSGALHVYSLSSDWRRHSTLLFCPSLLGQVISRVDKVFIQWSCEAWQRWDFWDRHTDSQVTWKYDQLYRHQMMGSSRLYASSLSFPPVFGTRTITPPLLLEHPSLSCLERCSQLLYSLYNCFFKNLLVVAGPIWILNVPPKYPCWRLGPQLKEGGNFRVGPCWRKLRHWSVQEPQVILVCFPAAMKWTGTLCHDVLILPQPQSNRDKHSGANMAETVSQNKHLLFLSRLFWAFCHTDGTIYSENIVGRKENGMGEGPTYSSFLKDLEEQPQKQRVGWTILCLAQVCGAGCSDRWWISPTVALSLTGWWGFAVLGCQPHPSTEQEGVVWPKPKVTIRASEEPRGKWAVAHFLG